MKSANDNRQVPPRPRCGLIPCIEKPLPERLAGSFFQDGSQGAGGMEPLEQLGFVKIPKDTIEIDPKKSDSLLLCEESLYREHGADKSETLKVFDFILRCRSLEESGAEADPLRAIEAVITSQELGVYPPLSVLKWLSDIFCQYFNQINEEAAPRIDEMMGLAGKKVTTTQAREHRDAAISRDMYILTNLFGLSDEQAAGHVCLKYSYMPKHPLFKLDLDPRRIKQISESQSDIWQKIFNEYPYPDKDIFLSTFPESVRNKLLK